MRVTTLAIASVCLLGCGKKSEETNKPDKGSDGAQGKVTEAPPPQVKKPVENKPLPELQADPGGATGKALWATGFGGLGIDPPRGLGVTAAGEVYAAGYFDGEIDFGGTIGKKAPVAGDDPKKKPSDAYLVKVGADGKVSWVQTFGAGRDDSANDVAVKGDKVIVVGNFLDSLKLGEFTKKSAGSDDAFVAQFDAKGEIQWLWNFGGIDSDGANAVAAMPDGGWVVGGSFSGSAEFG
jgi:hypothetical protein